MFNIVKKEMELAGKKLTIETGKMARQADGAVLVTYGETSVLTTVVAAKTANKGQDFFPLSVHYIEKFYAAGKIPGGFFKREGRPTERETLTSRLIDRPIRPLFPKEFLNETQVVCTVVSYDNENESDVAAMIGASAALTISGIPFLGPIGCSRVGYIDGEFVLNPTIQEMENSDLDLMVAGTQEGVLMVESEAQELPEDTMLDAVMFGWKGFQPVIDMIIDMAEDCAKDPWTLPEPEFDKEALKAEIKAEVEADFTAAYKLTDKQERVNALKASKTAAMDKFLPEDETSPITDAVINSLFKSIEGDIVRGSIIAGNNRIDGRDTKTVRPILAEAGVLPRVHGSTLFTRGETQALVVTTLGTAADEQRFDTLQGDEKSNFMLHYNFPPYSVGECGRMGGTGRREIGHGKLAWRAIRPMLPTAEEFPYTLRVVSEITESNGSSSMATVCGTSLALMDAGVPVKKPVAGIAMGLIKEGDDFAVLTDILGDEDHLGDMDFKVAGTAEGITALQMDIKITSITEEIMTVALKQAHDGRAHILGKMAEALTEARGELSENAPQIKTINIPKDKIRDVIGSGGSVIREIIEVTGAKIDIEDDGTVNVSAVNGDSIKAAIKWIEDLTATAEVGKVYEGKVSKIVEFGAFVTILPKTDGLLHISEISHEHVKNVTDYLKEGQMVEVKCLNIDPKGKIKLSMKALTEKPAKEEEGDAE